MRKGVFIPDITVEMFKNATLESVEEFMTSGQMEDIEIPERPHGEWVQQYKNDGKWHDMGYFDHMYKCSKCGSDGSQRWHFCPNCGTPMKKEGEAE